ncbi:MAG: D-alanyl-D-alanine carboxypeptidase/D-alanyl-D-alanine-endopeptidase [Symploca sp. SIO3E6]|nr:D-alanyl-D-alanine carboxypeptidase/D-alanyl-D-alanine-endopeptidase [Caldora sp. SIO3E6]
MKNILPSWETPNLLASCLLPSILRETQGRFASWLVFLILLINAQLTGELPAVAEPVPTEPKQSETSQGICVEQLDAAITEVIERPEFARSRWGILVEPLSSSTHLYSHEGERYFTPASNAKLLTTAAALHQLGEQFSIRTSVFSTGTIPDLASLQVVGRGDPSLTTAELKDLAQQLKGRGVRRVEQLIVEEGYFKEPAIHPTWEWSDIYTYYGAPVNSLILNENAAILRLMPQELGQPLQLSWDDTIASSQWQVENQTTTAAAGTPSSIQILGVLGEPVLQITGQMAVDAEPDIWALAILNPADYFLDSFRQILAEVGITVNQALVVTSPQTIEPKTELAAVESDLGDWLIPINQDSNNLYAEALFNTFGAESNADSGIAALQQSLTALGVDPETYFITDGSGLSRHNRVSPEAIVQTLKLMAQTPEAEVYRASLPVAGVSGTLKHRFQDTPLQGNLQAKTGGMTGVSALSGYLDLPNYQSLVFSVMVNRTEQPAAIQRQAINEIVLLLGSLRRVC